MIKYLIGMLSVVMCLTAMAANGPAARVVWVKGTFTADGRALARNSPIFQNETLSTAAGSQAEIVFTDNTLMTFKEGTNYTVNHYSLNKNGGGSFTGTLATGGFRTITGLVAKNNPGNYQINTPVATIGVRGTDYQAVMHNGALYVVVYAGTPCLQAQCSQDSLPGGSTQYGGQNFLNWVSNPAVYLPQVYAIADPQIQSICTTPVLLSPIPNEAFGAPGPFAFETASHFGGARLRYTAVGLPAGVIINPKTGVISGTNGATTGAFNSTVTVTAADPCGAVASTFVLTLDA